MNSIEKTVVQKLIDSLPTTEKLAIKAMLTPEHIDALVELARSTDCQMTLAYLLSPELFDGITPGVEADEPLTAHQRGGELLFRVKLAIVEENYAASYEVLKQMEESNNPRIQKALARHPAYTGKAIQSTQVQVKKGVVKKNSR